MYSPKIYETQIPSLYHAARNLEVPMTQLANAFIYYGLISGYYGEKTHELLPRPNEVVPVGIQPMMQIFNPRYNTICDYMLDLPLPGTLNPYFQSLRAYEERRLKTAAVLKGLREDNDESILI